MRAWLLKYPWLALLGWLPFIYLPGIVRVWGNPYYMFSWGAWLGGTSTLPSFWWPTRLYNRMRHERKMRD